MLYTPISLLFFLAFWLLFAVLLGLIQIGILQYVYTSMGVSRRYMMALLLFSLLGSYVNIPILRLPGEHLRVGEVVDFYGVQYVVPMLLNSPGTVLAINVGGALIPVILSAHLIIKNKIFGESLMAVGLVTLAVHAMAQPVRGVGIAVPIFIPPLVTAIVALILAPRNPAPLAYVAGSLGTLLGADLLNLNKVRDLGAPVASIGGAGKFDGIFLTGIVAVVLASFLGGQRREFEDQRRATE